MKKPALSIYHIKDTGIESWHYDCCVEIVCIAATEEQALTFWGTEKAGILIVTKLGMALPDAEARTVCVDWVEP